MTWGQCEIPTLHLVPPTRPQLELFLLPSLSKYLLHLLCAEEDSKWRFRALTKEDENPSSCRANRL